MCGLYLGPASNELLKIYEINYEIWSLNVTDIKKDIKFVGVIMVLWLC